MEQSYEITEDGKAKTLNPLGEKPPSIIDTPYRWDSTHDGDLKEWQAAEDSRVTYEIYYPCAYPCEVISLCECANRYTPGTIVKAEIINGKLRIL